jgi:hypothetical protein
VDALTHSLTAPAGLLVVAALLPARYLLRARAELAASTAPAEDIEINSQLRVLSEHVYF